ncbi:hypothetical protein Bpfe_010572 [Biomphalaria pfeifferi]|uniref:Uncharacterized protein n=1 Tax=Biomphalaria pfeifferi TaxID=112525 RepID=A0AAD8BSM1_BIOPF|nr:hypothetical protein Bpfe_010572 [Biomphalaria pfeifferi]
MGMIEILMVMPMIGSFMEESLREDVALMSTRVQGTVVGYMDLTRGEMEKQNIVGKRKRHEVVMLLDALEDGQ